MSSPIAKRHYRVTWSDAVHLHTRALETGGRPGTLNPHAVQSALARPYHGYHKRIHQKAAALLHGLVSNHGFTDGNKRTALLLVELLLRRSGYHLAADNRAFVDLIVGVADGSIPYDSLVEWFQDRIDRQPEDPKAR